ncbi:MAG TPA: pirin family protein [Acidimicrobiia bacterium]|nr:pirin family protein [Acidimicrobiia bacterium]
MSKQPVIDLVELGFPWEGLDPFIFTVHHVDAYPAGNESLGPTDSLSGRQVGADFSYLNGWSMYHGDVVPGFPQHPHRGFETVTVVRRGYVDHSDSLGATARYGEGDVQWLTTGTGIMHAEMFPLINPEGPNPLELFQIWLNLPPKSKLVPAYFGMLWGEDIPTISPAPGVGVDVIAGAIDDNRPPSPPPDSWAARSDSHLAIWLIRLAPGARWQLPLAPSAVNRMLHCFEGDDVRIGPARIGARVGARLEPDTGTTIENRGGPAEMLLLQGRPIGAPVFQLGPFVMNSAEELQTAVSDYHRTQFGGWPWSRRDPVHDRTEGRFAIHANGKVEQRDLLPAG